MCVRGSLLVSVAADATSISIGGWSAIGWYRIIIRVRLYRVPAKQTLLRKLPTTLYGARVRLKKTLHETGYGFLSEDCPAELEQWRRNYCFPVGFTVQYWCSVNFSSSIARRRTWHLAPVSPL